MVDALVLAGNFFLLIVNTILIFWQRKNLKKVKTLIDAMEKANGQVTIEEYIEDFKRNGGGR